MKRIALVANSKIANTPLMKEKILQNERIIAVDGGLGHCMKMGITPSLIIGDLDSATQEDLDKFSGVPRKPFPRDKDHSDLELAVMHSLEDSTAKITIFGALEERIDHSLSNLFLVTRFPGQIVIESDYETIHCITNFHEFNCEAGQQISLIPFPSPCSGVTTSGLKWELENRTLNNAFFSLSNVACDQSFTVEVKKGTLLCCLVRK